MRKFVIVKDGIARIMEAQDWIDNPMAEVAKWADSERAKVSSARPINPQDIPADKTYKDAWTDNGTNIVVDMVRARDIHADMISNALGREIAALKSKERSEGLRGGPSTARADREKLENLNISALSGDIKRAATPEDLKAIWPAKLPR